MTARVPNFVWQSPASRGLNFLSLSNVGTGKSLYNVLVMLSGGFWEDPYSVF